jgi:hypothetical protein
VTQTPGKLRKFPYFKVQTHDPLTLSWKDHRKEAFDDEDTARAYRTSIPKNIKTRLVKWDESGSHPVE